MIKNFIFDFGNVLTKYDIAGYAAEITGNKEIGEKVLEYTFLAPEWKKYDAGLVNEDEALALLKAAAPEKFHAGIEAIVRSFEKAFVQYEPMVPVLKAIKERGNRTFLLSNFPKGKYEQVADMCPILDLIDEPVVSYKIHKIKPDREIYEYILDRYELKAEECIFADDWAPNIDAARALGMYGHVFTTADSYIEYLKEIGVDLNV